MRRIVRGTTKTDNGSPRHLYMTCATRPLLIVQLRIPRSSGRRTRAGRNLNGQPCLASPLARGRRRIGVSETFGRELETRHVVQRQLRR